MCPRGRCVRSGSFDSLGCVRVVVGFIRLRSVNSGVPKGSLGSFRLVRYIRVRPCGRWVLLGSYGALGCAL